ncbi:MAG: glycosyltransferase family 39 protein [Nanoarchaeota archaeon]|nr:glycosyltransferase family 39 protein [Nanoarchaeota archaeon]
MGSSKADLKNRLMDFLVFLFIVFFLLLNIFFLKRFYLVGWDESVYVGMSKYISSAGQEGLFESLRPPAYPMTLAFLRIVGFDSVMHFRILSLFFFAGVLFLTYKISSVLFNKKIGFFSIVILGFTPVFFQHSFQLLTGIPSTFFALLSIYLLLKKRFFSAGVMFALGVLFRYPQGLILFGIICFFVSLFFSSKNYKQIFFQGLLFFAGLFLIIFTFIIINLFMYASTSDSIVVAAFYPFLKASEHQANPVYALVSFWDNLLFYPKNILFSNFSYAFLLVGLFFLFKNKFFSSQKNILFFVPLFLFLYFSLIVNKQARFAIIFIPYLAIIAGLGFEKVFSFKNSRIVKLCSLLLLFFILKNSFNLINSFWYPQQFNEPPTDVLKVYNYFDGFNGTVLSMIPMAAAYNDAKYVPFYFDDVEALIIYEQNPDAHAILFYNDFYPCEFFGPKCIERKKLLLENIRNDFKMIDNVSALGYDYLFFLKK